MIVSCFCFWKVCPVQRRQCYLRIPKAFFSGLRRPFCCNLSPRLQVLSLVQDPDSSVGSFHRDYKKVTDKGTMESHMEEKTNGSCTKLAQIVFLCWLQTSVQRLEFCCVLQSLWQWWKIYLAFFFSVVDLVKNVRRKYFSKPWLGQKRRRYMFKVHMTHLITFSQKHSYNDT